MIDNVIIRAFKELRVKMEATKFMEELYIDEKEYISTYIDKEKGLEIDNKIKATHQFYLKLKRYWKKLYDMIDDVCYSTLNDLEKIVFQEYFMNDMTAEQIQRKYKDMNIGLQTIYNIAHKINQQLKRIKLKTYIPLGE